MEWAKRPPSRKSVTQILQRLNLAQLYLTYRSSKKYINRGIYNVSFAYIGIFSAEINNFCYIKKYKYILHFKTQFLILLTFLQSLNFYLINIVLSITNKICWSCDSDYIVDVVSFIRIRPEKAIFLRGALCSSSIIWNWHRYGLEIFTSVAKFLRSNS